MSSLYQSLPVRFIPLLLGSLAVLVTAIPGWAQTERYPTSEEIDLLLRQMRLDIPQLVETGIYRDYRPPGERQRREAFVNAWAEVDPLTAPFLGEWFAIEESLAIFPTANTGEVCIVNVYLGESQLHFGRVTDGKIYTELNLVFALDSGFLGSIFVYDGEAALYEYANPLPLLNPTTSPFFEQYPSIVRQFREAGCLAELPE